jgi:diadenylate cyclase
MQELIFLIQIGFLTVTLWDILDILIVGYLLYQIFKLLRGSLGFNIFLGLVFIYVLWWLVSALGMPLLTTILGQFISVGMIALLILFQPEVRRFLLFVGQGSLQSQFVERLLNRANTTSDPQKEKSIREIIRASEEMAADKVGALMLISLGAGLEGYYSSGVMLNAEVSTQLLLSIFNKHSPLHDGATIISGNQVVAASCVLPVSDRPGIPQSLGLRHRAAIGITEATNVVAFIISEETGQISFARRGEIVQNISSEQMGKLLRKTIG